MSIEPIADRVGAIRAALVLAFEPTYLAVHDDSHRHVGHEGARDGRGHFTVEIASPALASVGALAAHRAIYAALGTLMETDIHALSIRCLPQSGGGTEV